MSLGVDAHAVENTTSSLSLALITMSSEFQSLIKTLRAGQKPEFPPDARSIDYARQLDSQDKLGSFREKFNIPTRGSLRKKALSGRATGMPLVFCLRP